MGARKAHTPKLIYKKVNLFIERNALLATTIKRRIINIIPLCIK
jgi:hypothetical protein